MRDKMKESRFKPIDYVRTHYHATAEEGTPIDAILKPEYFAHVARLVRIGDEITVVSEDGSYRLHLEVADKANLWVRVHLLHKWEWVGENAEPQPDVGEKPANPDEPYKALWKGPAIRWCIQRQSDGMIVQENIEDKAQAIKIAATFDGKVV